MSKHHKEAVECPCCHYQGEFDLWESVNVDLNPELREQIMDGRLFVWSCPKCESNIIIPYGTLYHDMKHHFMLFYSHECDEEEGDKYAPMKMPKDFPLDGYTLRVVYGLSHLKEKILIFEEGLNDVAIERLKFMFSHISFPEFAEKGHELFFDHVDRTYEDSEYGAIVFVYYDKEKNKEMLAHIPMEVYYNFCLVVELDPRMQVNDCMCIDQGWMAKQLCCAKEDLGSSSSIMEVDDGFFSFCRTKRKTKTTPTRYLYGIGHECGVLLFPPLFENLRWLGEQGKEAFYVELDDKPYVFTIDGSMFDPQRQHFPAKDGSSDVKDNFRFYGVKEDTVCYGCVFASEINDKGQGCGCLVQEEFRKNYLKDRCDHRKASYNELSDYERNEQNRLREESLRAAKECNAYALSLVKDFIADELEGDINRLKDYDFNLLRSEDDSRQKAVEKYLACIGGVMQEPDLAIVRAISSLVFGRAWEGFTLESMDKYKFKVDYLHPLMYLFGAPIGLEWGMKQFNGLDKFDPSEDLRERVFRFWHLHRSIGNIILLPAMLTQNSVEINLTRAKRMWRNYPDRFLQELREELVDETHRNKYLQAELYKNRKIYVHCKSKEGFDRLMKELLLEDFLDENGNPVHLFAGVGFMDKNLDRETYLKAVDEYLDFCEKEIPRRAECIIHRLQFILENS